MKLGFIGLGKMGSRMAAKLLNEKHELVVWNRSPGPAVELLNEQQTLAGGGTALGRLTMATAPANLIEQLQPPRVIWLMLPAGAATETNLEMLSGLVSPADILVDGGNSHYKDTESRYQRFSQKKIRYLGIGVSGGIIAAREGYPLMAGGDRSAYDYIRPVLESLARPHGGHEYFGSGGAGHFVKMVHNGIEYGIMQSLAEGFGVLQKAPYPFDLAKIARLYQRGTLVSGFMLDRAVEVLEKDPALQDLRGIIAESGEGRWTIDQASEEGLDVEIIRRSLDYRRRSQMDPGVQQSFTARMVAALRNAFGGHEVVKK